MYIYVCIYIYTRATSAPSTAQVVALNPTRNLAAPAAIEAALDHPGPAKVLKPF